MKKHKIKKLYCKVNGGKSKKKKTKKTGTRSQKVCKYPKLKFSTLKTQLKLAHRNDITIVHFYGYNISEKTQNKLENVARILFGIDP